MKAKIAALALLTSASFTTNAFPASVTEHIMYCGNGNFYGEVKYKKIVTQDYVWLNVYQYRIMKFNDQSGGNKANINIRYTNQKLTNSGWRMQRSSWNSPDDRIQNSKWHGMPERSGSIMRKTENLGHADTAYSSMQVEFIFDKKGTDPKCTAYTTHADRLLR